MELFYASVFTVLAILCAYLEITNKSASNNGQVTSDAFRTFRNNYLVVYALMMAGDWLQGPYVYALYQYYGYTTGDIGKLFIAGFGSSMIFGTIVGSLADRFGVHDGSAKEFANPGSGRKVASLTYCATYIVSCFTKHSPNYWILMVGRLTGGIATSLLFSAFESWLVAEHFKRGFEGAWLSEVFSKAIFLGNGVVAIASGLIANFLVTNMEFGPVAPFDAAAVFLAIGAVIIATTWPENFGDNTSASSQSLSLQFQRAANTIKSDPKIFLLGAMQSLFEGSMYTFVFLWTPALSPNGEKIPHGFIFACFMVACMIGSSLASRLLQQSERGGTPVEQYMRYVFAAASVSLFMPVLLGFLGLLKGKPDGDGMSFAGKILFSGFLVFEVTVGIFWPSLMKLRSQLIPEESRSTIMNFFRIPLNLFVCIVLYNVSAFEMSTMFVMCSAFLALCAVLSDRLAVILKATRQQAQPEASKLLSLQGQEGETKSDDLGRPTSRSGQMSPA